MTLLEAKAHACCKTIDDIFEEAYNCNIPQELKDEHLKEILKFFNKLDAKIKELQ